MFGHFNVHRWNVKHLPFFVTKGLHLLQVGCTMRTTTDWMMLDVVWFGHHLERMTRLSFLTPWTTSAFLAQTASGRLFQTIAAGWIARVAAVFGQLVLQFLDEESLFSKFVVAGSR